MICVQRRSVRAQMNGRAAGLEPSPFVLVRRGATRSDRGPSGQQEPSGAPRKGEEQYGRSGEHSQGAHGDRGSKRLRRSDTRGGERRGSGACLSGCARWPDRQCCGRGTGAEKKKREWERITQSKRAEEDEARHPADEPEARLAGESSKSGSVESLNVLDDAVEGRALATDSRCSRLPCSTGRCTGRSPRSGSAARPSTGTSRGTSPERWRSAGRRPSDVARRH